MLIQLFGGPKNGEWIEYDLPTSINLAKLVVSQKDASASTYVLKIAEGSSPWFQFEEEL